MDKQDQEIKKALERMQSPISDPEFTDRVVALHLAKADQKTRMMQVDFSSLLTGMIAVVVSVLLSSANAVLEIGLTEDQVSVIQLLPILYLIFQVMNEYFNYKDRSGLKLSIAAKSLFIGMICTGMALDSGEMDRPEHTAFGETSKSVVIHFIEEPDQGFR